MNMRELCRCTRNFVFLLILAVSANMVNAGTTVTLNVRDYGAVGAATTDDTSAFQRAMDDCTKSGGGIVFVPVGQYMIRTHLNIPPYVVLKGVSEAPPPTSNEMGSRLLAVESRGNENGTPFLFMNRASGLHGISIFYPEQKDDNIVAYPWTIHGFGDNISLVNVLLVNPYKAVDFGTQPAGRHYINGLYGQALKTGLFIDKCFDVGRAENVHFWPFWSERAMPWTLANGTAFVIGRTDWQYMTNCFAISYKVGYHFIEGDDGPGNTVLTQCGSDIGPVAIQVDAVQRHSGVSFVNGQFMAGVEISADNQGPVKFTGCGFWGYGKTDYHALIRGGGHVTFTGCHFAWWGQVDRNSPAIIAESGGVTLSGCEFLDEEPGKQHILLKEDVEAAAIFGNRFRVPVAIVNRSEGDVTIFSNVGGKEPRLLAALNNRQPDEIVDVWKSRLSNSSITSQPLDQRLASAQGLIGSSHELSRKELLESVVTDGDAAHRGETFARRAEDELRLDDGKEPRRPLVSASPARAAIAVDGKLDEVEWQGSTVTRMASQKETEPEAELRIQYDKTALYVGATIHEPQMKKLKTNASDHDGKIWDDDSVEVFLSPARITHKYYQFIVNSSGVTYDGIGTLRTTSAGWESSATVAASRGTDSWSFEMAIPWSDFGYPAPVPGEFWAIDFRRWRHAGGKAEYSSWADAPLKGTTHHAEAFGYLKFAAGNR